MDQSLETKLQAAEKRTGLPEGLLRSIIKQETGGKQDYLDDPSKYHYGLNAAGKRIAGHTGQISTAFGPFGILESTGSKPGYGVAPLADKSIDEQVRFASDYLAARVKSAGSVSAGLAGYGEGEKYSRQVLSRLGRVPEAALPSEVPAVAPKRAEPPQRPEGWPVLPTARDARKNAAAALPDARMGIVGAAAAETVGSLDSQPSRDNTAASVAAAEAAEAERQATGVGAVFTAGRHDPRLNPTFTILDYMNKDQEVVPEGWTYAANRDAIEAGKSDEEREYLRENVKGPQSLATANGQLEYRRGLDRTYGLAGGLATFAGSMGAGMLDPVGFAAGLGAGKALSAVGIGSRVLANAGRPGAAATSFVGENIFVNVGLEGVQDYMGEVKTTADYAMAAASGAALAAPFVRSVSKGDFPTHVVDMLDDIRTKGINEQLDKAATVVRETGETDPIKIAKEVQERELNDILDTVQETTRPTIIREQLVPASLLDEQRAILDGQPIKDPVQMDRPKEPPTLTDVVEEPVLMDRPQDPPTLTDVVPEPPKVNEDAFPTLFTPEQIPEVAKVVETQKSITRDLGDGNSVVLEMDRVKANSPAHATVRETLNELVSSGKLSGADAQTAKYFSKVLSDDVQGVGIRFIKDGKHGLYKGQEQRINAPVTGEAATLKDRVAGMNAWQTSTILHEIGHAATHAKIEAFKTGKAGAKIDKVATQLEDLRERFNVAMRDKYYADGVEPSRARYEVTYAAKNLHEFAAQAWSSPPVRDFLRGMEGKPVAGQASSAWQEMLNIISRMLGMSKKDGLTEATKLLDQLISLDGSNIKYRTGEPTLQGGKPIADSPQFGKWFGKSTVTNPDGTPKVMYHGTAQDIREFKPKQAGAIFVTEDPKFAAAFAKDSEKWMRRNAPDAEPGQNVMPLYVKAEKVFDPEDATLRKEVLDDAFATSAVTNNRGEQVIRAEEGNPGYDRESAEQALSGFDGQDTWVVMEMPAVQEAIRKRKFDGFYVTEHGRKNLAVYQPNQVKSALGDIESYSDSSDILKGPVSPQVLQQFAQRYAVGVHASAKAFLAKNPISVAKLAPLTKKFGGLSDGLVLANSKNPVMQMVSALVTETTTGAAGRKATASVRTHMLNNKLRGNLIPDYESAFTVWGKDNGVTIKDLAIGGDKRREFDKTVYTEILNRRDPNYSPHRDQSVVRAADSLEAMFDRSRIAQVEAGTLGSNHLANTSRGYVPQALDAAKLQNLSTADLHAVHQKLSEQFQQRLGWDAQFADTFAPYYTNRVRERGQGSHSTDMLAAGGDGAQSVRDTLELMGQDATLRDRAQAAQAAIGPGHTKKRLDLDLREEYAPGKQLMDVYNTDPLTLGRTYAGRTAGTVALTESGILGIRGVRQLRDAAGAAVDGSEPPSKLEFDAYDRVMAEILGTQVAGRVVSAGATNLGMIVNLQKMGGLVFTQAADTLNMIHTLGMGSLLNGVPTLARHLREGRKVLKGGVSDNPITGSWESYGGSVGMENYRMVARLDAPDALVSEYMDQAGVASRLLRAGTHLQAKISGFRALMMAQHRMVAEQVMMKAARYIRDGGDHKALADMGLTPEVVQGMKNDLDRIAKWDSSGALTEFDMTQVSDPRTAEAFSQAVHRGVSQIIQGTFVGERNKWAHNDYLRVMLQLRTFGLTAMEKQWARTGMDRGYHVAAFALLGQMALALPMHIARVQLNSVGREDREKFLQDNLNPSALVRATMNYASLSGLTGDMMDTLIGIGGGWADQETKEIIGARNQAMGVGRLIPAAGTVDTALKVVSGKADTYTAIKQLPFTSLWYLAPIVNIAKKE